LTQTEYALIVAGGKGTRIKSELPKQFLALNGKPVLLHTLEAFFRYSEKIKIILVLPADTFSTWEQISQTYNFKRTITLQAGGNSRFQSVKKGLEKIEGDGLVAIHDGVRPLVSEKIIRDSFTFARVHRSAVASVQLKESIRMLKESSDLRPGSNSLLEGTHSMDRSRFRIIQTPQTFQIKLIKQAYDIPEDLSLTDDASVAERAGYRVNLFEGSYENLKITTEEDLITAEALLRKNNRM
jgi:2-C-methyl-D-erythritol 4-phosphate cytidylyltransferase